MFASNRRRSTGYRGHCRAYSNLATVQKGRKKHKIRTLAHAHTHTLTNVYPTHTIRPPNIRANRINYDGASSSLARYFGNNRRARAPRHDRPEIVLGKRCFVNRTRKRFSVIRQIKMLYNTIGSYYDSCPSPKSFYLTVGIYVH